MNKCNICGESLKQPGYSKPLSSHQCNPLVLIEQIEALKADLELIASFSEIAGFKNLLAAAKSWDNGHRIKGPGKST